MASCNQLCMVYMYDGMNTLQLGKWKTKRHIQVYYMEGSLSKL